MSAKRQYDVVETVRRKLWETGESQLPVERALEVLGEAAADADSDMRSRGRRRMVWGGSILATIVSVVFAAFQSYEEAIRIEIEKEIRAQINTEKNDAKINDTVNELDTFKKYVSGLKDAADEAHRRIEGKIDTVSDDVKEILKRGRRK